MRALFIPIAAVASFLSVGLFVANCYLAYRHSYHQQYLAVRALQEHIGESETTLSLAVLPDESWSARVFIPKEERVFIRAVQYCGVPSENELDLLSRCRIIRAISFLMAELGEDAVTQLADSSVSTEVLDFSSSTVGDSCIKHLSRVDGLEILELEHTNCTRKCLSDLSGIRDLKSLTIGPMTLEQKDVELLQSLRRLTALRIVASSLAEDVRFEGFNRLRHLELYAGVYDAKVIVGVKTLESLRRMPQLETLHCVDVGGLAGNLHLLRDLTNLRRLDLRGVELTIADVQSLERLPQLGFLRVSEEDLGEEVADRLTRGNLRHAVEKAKANQKGRFEEFTDYRWYE